MTGLLLLAAAVVTGDSAPALALSQIVNGSFEDPVCAQNPAPSTWNSCLNSAATVPGWDTTDINNDIEIWTGTIPGQNNRPPAYSGNQFAELNATSASTLYQDVSGFLFGESIGYELAHRGREGVDTMKLDVIDPGPDLTFGTADDIPLLQQSFSTGNTAWVLYSQANAFTTQSSRPLRFAYEAISSAGGDPSLGNFIDSVSFGVGVGASPAPAPLPLMGAAAAMAWSRGLRRRLGLRSSNGRDSD